jgi:hypothetical protein
VYSSCYSPFTGSNVERHLANDLTNTNTSTRRMAPRHVSHNRCIIVLHCLVASNTYTRTHNPCTETIPVSFTSQPCALNCWEKEDLPPATHHQNTQLLMQIHFDVNILSCPLCVCCITCVIIFMSFIAYSLCVSLNKTTPVFPSGYRGKKSFSGLSYSLFQTIINTVSYSPANCVISVFTPSTTSGC